MPPLLHLALMWLLVLVIGAVLWIAVRYDRRDQQRHERQMRRLRGQR